MKKIIEAIKQGYQQGYNETRKPRLRGDGQPVHFETSSATKHRQSVEANVIRACSVCSAPGTWMSTKEVKENWPGCWVEPLSNAKGFPVGDKCPNCGSTRPTVEALGEIWVKEEV